MPAAIWYFSNNKYTTNNTYDNEMGSYKIRTVPHLQVLSYAEKLLKIYTMVKLSSH